MSEEDVEEEEEAETPMRRLRAKRSGSDMEELREVLKIVREEVPGLLKDITGPLKEILGITFATTEEEAERKAKAIARFYKELVDAGIDKDVALQMTQSSFINPMDLISKLSETWTKKMAAKKRAKPAEEEEHSSS
ncbi:MAG: hypothetical protein AYL32_008840 [Candidatus Bathyarchaeota archaeon B26-2]|nr:MAG: hypothetical protein AYL32_008840 [Candidatus Bathyarchaeota archaeon B26-2]